MHTYIAIIIIYFFSTLLPATVHLYCIRQISMYMSLLSNRCYEFVADSNSFTFFLLSTFSNCCCWWRWPFNQICSEPSSFFTPLHSSFERLSRRSRLSFCRRSRLLWGVGPHAFLRLLTWSSSRLTALLHQREHAVISWQKIKMKPAETVFRTYDLLLVKTRSVY